MRFYGICLFLILALSASAFAQKNQFSFQAQVFNSAPDFIAASLSGEIYKLSDLKGKIVVLNFWSVKCPACENETSDLNKLVDDYQNKDVVFLAFAHDAQPKVQNFLRRNPFKYEIFPASLQQMMVPYGRPVGNGFFDLPFPMHIVINKEGIIEVNELGRKGVKAVRRKLAELTE